MRDAIGEHDRLISNIVRMGVITGVDLANARVTVDAGGVSSDWLPWITVRAGTTNKWSPPVVGEQVVVLSPYGDMGQGVVLPGIYQDAFPAQSAAVNIDLTTYPDGSTVQYDSSAHVLTVNVGTGSVVVNCANANVNATAQATINTPTTTITGNAHIEGNLQVDGTTTSAGLLTYQAGMAGSGGGTHSATITGSMQITGGDVVVDGIGSKAHHHIEHDGPSTGAAQA